MPTWIGAPARLVELVLATAILILLAELLGLAGLLYRWPLVVFALLAAGGAAWWSRRSSADASTARTRGPGASDSIRGPSGWSLVVMTGAIGIVVAHWGLTIDSA